MRECFESFLLACIVLPLSLSSATRSCCAQAEADTPPAVVAEQDGQGRPKNSDAASTPTISGPGEENPDEGDICSAPEAPLERIIHQVELADPVFPSTPATVYDVVLSRDRNGFPVEYGLSLVTHVCTDGQCEVVEVTMVWDALGYFERLRCPPGKRLTKKEHEPFTAEDYAKLDRILKDHGSILGSWTLAFLERPVEIGDGVDAVTSATPITVQDSVIQEAEYTTWALWHWANGEIVPKLRGITKQNCSPAYLNHLLVSEDLRCTDFALDYVMEQHPSDPRFVQSVFHILENGERDLIIRSLEFLIHAIPDKRRLHARLIESCCRMRSTDCPMILQELAADPDLPATTIEGLTGRLSRLPYFPIHLILRMLEERTFASEKTISDVAALLDSDDFFIARRAYAHLVKQDLNADTEDKVNAFRERNRGRL